MWDAWNLPSQFLSQIGVEGYGTKDWLQLCAAALAIAGYVYGLWKAYRYSKRQIAKRLLEYLEDERAAIKEARAAVVRHVRYAQPLPKQPNHPFFRNFKQALAQLDRGETVRAEEQLADLAKVGETYVANANLQTATALLVLGRIARARSDTVAAKTAWETALRCNPDDAEAARYLGELALALGDADTAWEQFARAAELAPDDKLLKAETTELRAKFYRARHNPKLELGALNRCAPNFADAGAHDRAAAAYARAGEIAAELGQSVQAPVALRRAFDNYNLAGDRAGMRRMLESLETLGEDVSDLPTLHRLPKTPRFHVRLAIALSILAMAACLYLTLR